MDVRSRCKGKVLLTVITVEAAIDGLPDERKVIAVIATMPEID